MIDEVKRNLKKSRVSFRHGRKVYQLRDATYRGIPARLLGAFGRRKLENQIILREPKEKITVIV